MLLKPEKSKSFISNKEIASVIINLALVAKSSACLAKDCIFRQKH